MGPPKRAEIAANDPAVATSPLSLWPSRAKCVSVSPTTEPSAIRGASGPSTAPKPSVPSAASATPAPYAGGVGRVPSPSSGAWPQSPGRSRRAARTTQAPTTGSPITRYHGGDEWPRLSGRSVQSQCSTSWTSARKSAASSAAGAPISAPNRTRRRYAAASSGGGDGLLSLAGSALIAGAPILPQRPRRQQRAAGAGSRAAHQD